MKIFFDTEFIEDGKTIDLISIGLVREDGETYYAESNECNFDKADKWIFDNIVPHLNGKQKSRKKIAEEIIEFVGDSPEFWAYYADYNWVVLCQLYGRMIDIPIRWPMFCRDLKQSLDLLGDPDVPKQTSNEHDALADASWVKETFERYVDQ